MRASRCSRLAPNVGMLRRLMANGLLRLSAALRAGIALARLLVLTLHFLFASNGSGGE
jgi:hypothetical protein